MVVPRLLWLKEFYVDRDIRKAETLPPSAFISEEFLKRELETVFSNSWLLIPPADQATSSGTSDLLKQKGARIPFSILGKPLFLQRDDEGQLHCFPNVCTHAWHPLVEAPGVERTIMCPQHGRQFSSKGKFVTQAGFSGLENFPRGSDHLRNFPVEEWNGLIFTCLGQAAAPLREFVREVDLSLAGLSLSGLRRRVLGFEVREVEGNWKQHAWNYMDNFHIRFVHKGPGGLADAVDFSSYQTELYKCSALQWVYSRRPENGFSPELLAARFRDPQNPERRVFALWWFIFPNLTLNLYPWGLSLNVYAPIPDNPDRTQFFWYHYVLDEEKFERRNDIWLDEQVDAEDLDAISQVARGTRSGFAPRGRFAPREEAGPHWFHRLVYETVFGKEPAK